MPTFYSSAIKLNKHYNNQTFPYSSVLSSQKLIDFQSGLQGALARLAMTYSNMGDWGIVGSITNYLDAFFCEDLVSGDPNLSTYYSFGDSVRHIDQTPDPPKYYIIASGDSLYFGHRTPFPGLTFAFSTVAGGSISPSWEYWKGAWTVVTGLTDLTNGFQNNGKVSWDLPRDWEIDSLDTILALKRFSLDTEDRFWAKVTLGSTQVFEIDTILRDYYDWELKVRSTNPEGKSILIYPGFAIINSRVVRVKEIQTMDLTTYADASGNRNIIIQLNEDGTLSAKIESAVAPAAPDEDESEYNAIKLAIIYMANGESIIYGSTDGFGNGYSVVPPLNNIHNCEGYLPSP